MLIATAIATMAISVAALLVYFAKVRKTLNALEQ
jgi:hypothetical protein